MKKNQNMVSLEDEKSRPEYQAIVHKCETYFRFVCTLDENIKYILEKSQKDFAAFMGLNYGDIINSIAFHSDSDESDTSV